MWMRWDILSKGVWKSPSEDVPRTLVFHVHRCKESYKRIFSCTHPKSRTIIISLQLTVINRYHINGLHRFWNPLYIYIYIWLNIIDIFVYIYFVYPFELPYWSYDIRKELADKPSIISYFPSVFYPTLGHHQVRIYYKSDVTFVCTLLLRKNERFFQYDNSKGLTKNM